MAPKRLGKKERAAALAAKREQIAAEEVEAPDDAVEADAPADAATDAAPTAAAGAGAASGPVAGASAGAGGAVAAGSGEFASADDDLSRPPPPSHEAVFEKALAGITLTSAVSKRGPRNSRGA
jgi:hypothetical protein